jgi:hypothetical protein
MRIQRNRGEEAKEEERRKKSSPLRSCVAKEMIAKSGGKTRNFAEQVVNCDHPTTG